MKRINPLFAALALALLSACAARPENPPPPPPAPAVAEAEARPALDAKYTSARSLDVADAVMRKWKHLPVTDQNARALVRIETTKDGDVVVAEVTQSDGDSAFNDSVVKAVYRASQLPTAEDRNQFDPIVNICISKDPNRCR